MLLLLVLACAATPAPSLTDEDCDGIVSGFDCDDRDDDRGLPPTWYGDSDGDGYGDIAAPAEACERPENAVADATDCDDADASANPSGEERCGGGDEDCDGAIDDADSSVSDTTTWYADEDGDGLGGEEIGAACAALGVAEGGDCDDANPQRVEGCRPEADCVHPDVDTLAGVADLGVSDVLFDEGCFAYLSTVLTYDEIQLIHPSGLEVASFETWAAVTDLPALTLDPDDGDIWVVGVTADGNAPMVGRVVDGAVEHVADGIYTLGTSWIGVYMNRNAQSIVSDGTCVWVPNFAGDGTVVCVEEDGTQTTRTTLPQRAESVALSPAGVLYASSGTTIWAIDEAGALSEAWTFDAAVLDFVFDYDGSVYVETAGDLVLLADESGSTTFAEVQYDGKLTITVDGWLVRLMPYWSGGTADIASLWEEWPL